MSTAQVSNIPISVDYTGRDYYSIREQLIARIQERIPEWTASDPADFGVALVEAFAYMGDLISYYIDRTANEFSLATATQRNSLLNIAQTYGYIPAGYRSSTVELTFFNNNTPAVSGNLTATGNGTSITYVGNNSFVVNGVVTVTGFSTTSFNVQQHILHLPHQPSLPWLYQELVELLPVQVLQLWHTQQSQSLKERL